MTDKFFCPTREDRIKESECDEIRGGKEQVSLPKGENSSFLPIEMVSKKQQLCFSCQKARKHERIKKQLAVRGMEYTMFLDDDG